MFCTKLKELKISGECPFSSSAKSNQLEHSELLSKDVARLSTSKDVHRNTGENAPHQKSSRAKVNLHTLGESIRKLACPEVRKNTHHWCDFPETLRICVVCNCTQQIFERLAKPWPLTQHSHTVWTAAHCPPTNDETIRSQQGACEVKKKKKSARFKHSSRQDVKRKHVCNEMPHCCCYSTFMHWFHRLVWKLYQAWKTGYVQIFLLLHGRRWMLWIPRQKEISLESVKITWSADIWIGG